MNLEKSKKRISKKVKMGFQGYPVITIAYFGVSEDFANQVVIEFVAEEGEDAQVEKFNTKGDTREDDVIQSAIVKMIERSGAKTVVQVEGVVSPDNS